MSAQAARVLLIAHPDAGGGRALRRVEALRATTSWLKSCSEVVCVRTVDDAAQAVAAITGDAVVVAAGGDGTANLVAQALLRSGSHDVPLGVLPLGTGNAFAHSLGTGSISAALEAIQKRESERIDVLRTTHPSAPLALVSISTGFESEFIQRYTHRRRLGRLPAALYAAAHSGLHSSTGIRVSLDDEAFVLAEERIHNVGLYNLPCYAGGLRVWPDANACDGRGEAVACRLRRTYWRVLWRGQSTERPAPGAEPRVRRWRTARIDTKRNVQVDGEGVAGGDFVVQVEPAALRVLVNRTTPRV